MDFARSLNIPVVDSTASIHMDKEIHRSNENVCYLGRWVEHPEAGTVVIKRLIISRSESLLKFEDEVEMILDESLKGYIARPLAIVRDPPHYSIILKYAQHGSLDHVVHNANLPLSFEFMLCLAHDAAKSLAAVHRANIIHRDIKTANFLVDDNWKVTLTDFGSAWKVFSEEEEKQGKRHRVTAPTGGFHKRDMDGTTLLYTAPEILRLRAATQKSDIYSFGISLGELITAYYPYNTVEKVEADMHTVLDASYSRQSLSVAIVNDGLRPPLRISRHQDALADATPVAEDMNKLIEYCWHHDPNERPTAQQVVEAIEKIAAANNVDLAQDRAALAQTALQRKEKVSLVVDDMNIESDGMDMDSTGEPSPAGAIPNSVNLTGSGVGALQRGGETIKVNNSLKIGAYATAGMRGADKMEDRHAITHTSLPSGGALSVCSVFDGHGGASCAEYCSQRLNGRVHQAISTFVNDSAQREVAVRKQFVEVDEAFRQTFRNDKSGCTAMTLAIWDSATAPGKRQIMVSNAGDCRAILCKRDRQSGATKVVRLSRDLNADDAQECDRIRAAGGQIIRTSDGRNRVQGHIQVTRSLGDAFMKSYGVCADPEVLEYTVDDSVDEFLVLATDGLYDVMSDERVVQGVLNTAREPGLAAKRLGGDALGSGSRDNISVIVVFLRDLKNDSVTFKSG